MADNKDLLPRKYDVNAKWDACLDLSVRHFVYSSLASAFGESPVTRWASVAFGAGIGIGSAYTDCSRTFDVSSAMLAPPKPVDAPAPSPATEDAQERANPVEVKVLNPDFFES